MPVCPSNLLSPLSLPQFERKRAEILYADMSVHRHCRAHPSIEEKLLYLASRKKIENLVGNFFGIT